MQKLQNSQSGMLMMLMTPNRSVERAAELRIEYYTHSIRMGSSRKVEEIPEM
jgi:hypothetical protein